MVLNFANQQPAPKPQPAAAPTAPTSQPAAANNTAEPTNELTRMTTNEQRESGDSVAPLPSSLIRTNSISKPAAAGGLWGGKPQATTHQGLWGSPKLTGVTERESGPKRRWTITEHNQ
jgi:hypothetical protein